MIYVFNNYSSPSIEQEHNFDTWDEAFTFCEELSGNFPFNKCKKSVIKWKYHANTKELWGWIHGFKDSSNGKLIPTFIVNEITNK